MDDDQSLGTGVRVKHIDTNRVGRVEGKTTENGSDKLRIRWTNGQISTVSEENLVAI